MSERIWDRFLTERDKEVFAASGYGVRGGFGKRPALLVIDVSWGFAGDKPEPILESIKRWSNSCGAESWDAIAVIKQLAGAFRAKGLPVIYTTGQNRTDGWDVGSWAWKNSRTGESLPTQTQDLDANEIVSDIAPMPQDIVIYKQKPSGFFGTNMASYLTLLGCDSVIVTGTTTSGCVRATVLDAFSLNYRVAVAEDGCFDRSEASHAINLCDMNAKYADVVPSTEILAYVAGLEDGLISNLPQGVPPATRPKLVAAE
jgi:nicotinamidase-related amidase